MTKKITIALALMLSAVCMRAQEHALGLIIDEAAYNAIPVKAQLLTRDYTNVPNNYSLKAYCPTPRSQGQHGTCTSWATAYAARTIAEAVNNGWTDRTTINRSIFAPMFVYAQINTVRNDKNCQNGTSIDRALQLMKNKGVPKMSAFTPQCACDVPSNLFNDALKYKITDYFTLFNSLEKSEVRKVSAIKKAISQNRPVLIGMEVYSSFDRAEGVWNGKRDSHRGGHAMCIIGYDDNKYGGAFELMNSWGTDWGNDGFIWVRYSDLCANVDWAWEMYVEKGKTEDDKPTPTPVVPKNTLSGDIEMTLSSGKSMSPQRTSAPSVATFRMAGSYISGTRYRLYISNDEPAYVYVLGSDLTNSVSRVFPPADNISPALVYASNHIAIPDEKWFIEMDDTKGTDYICVLYSKSALDIKQIISRIQNASGSFQDKVKTALGKQMVSASETRFGQTGISFSATSYSQVVPVVIEIDHK